MLGVARPDEVGEVVGSGRAIRQVAIVPDLGLRQISKVVERLHGFRLLGVRAARIESRHQRLHIGRAAGALDPGEVLLQERRERRAVVMSAQRKQAVRSFRTLSPTWQAHRGLASVSGKPLQESSGSPAASASVGILALLANGIKARTDGS